MNTDEQGCAKTVLAGYFKYGAATLIGGGYGTTGTVIIEIEDESDYREHETGQGDPESN